MEYIKNLEDLLNMTRKGEYVLAADIDGKGQMITCIIGDFSGKIDGAGHKIKNLVISDKIWGDEQTLAMFYSMNKAELLNIVFEDIRIEYDRACYNPRVAVLAGNCSNSTIRNVFISATESIGADLTMIYAANDCELRDNEILCNGKLTAIAKYI